jgi:hypothetical protein
MDDKQASRGTSAAAARLGALLVLSLFLLGMVPSPAASANQGPQDSGHGDHPKHCAPRHNPALGWTCPEAGGILLFNDRGQRPIGFTHAGQDAPPSAADSYPSSGNYAARHALHCSDEDYKTKILYVRPSNVTDHYSLLLPGIREIAENANAKIDKASMKVGVHATIKVECTNGLSGDYTVHNVTLHCHDPDPWVCNPGVSDALGISWGDIRSRLLNGDADEEVGGTIHAGQAFTEKETHYWILYDGMFNRENDTATKPLVCTGRGDIELDSHLGEDNLNNGHGYVHVAMTPHCPGDVTSPTYKPSISPYTWTHEWGHNSGAVQPTKPADPPRPANEGSLHFTWGWHCTDGNDVMCYNDHSTQDAGEPPIAGHNGANYAPTTCTGSTPYYNDDPFDCNQDDYFNRHPTPAPAHPATDCPGSGTTYHYLACHWNLGDDVHHYIWFGNGPPKASFDWVPRACVGSVVTFRNTSEAGPYPLANATWTFVDPAAGTTTVYGPESPDTSHSLTFEWPTTLTVTLDQADTSGNSTQKTEFVPVDVCPQTWAAGDLVGGQFVAAGNDPGCGLGAPDSLERYPSDSTVDIAAWHGLAPLPEGRFLAAAVTQQASDRMTLAGGTRETTFANGTIECKFPPLDTALTYDAASNSWWAAPPMHQARIAPAAAAVSSTKAIWAGGDRTGGDPKNASTAHIPTASAEEWDGSAWTPIQDMPAGVIGAAAAFTDNREGVGGFQVSGGFSHPQETNRLIQTYDPLSGRWLGSHLPEPRTAFKAESCTGVPVAIGGLVGESNPMHTFDSATATNTVVGAVPTLTWLPYATLPQKTAFEQATQWGPWVYIQGGFVPGSTIASNQLLRMPCAALGLVPALPFPPLPPQLSPPNVADGVMEASTLQLWTFGGTRTMTPTTGTQARPDCGTNQVWMTDPLTGITIEASHPPVPVPSVLGLTPSLPVTLPQKEASMGSATLADGRIVIVGGRVDNGSTCYAPNEKVWIFDPLHYTWAAGPDLPKGLIAPAVEAVGNVVFVSGGDDRGDIPVPASATDPRPFHPSADTLYYDFSGGAPTWTATESAPMGVVNGEFALYNTAPGLGIPGIAGATASGGTPTLWLIGGNHHPNATVRLVQEMAGSKAGPWLTPTIPGARGHHGMEYCAATGELEVFNGITAGTVYHTPDGISGDWYHGAPGAWMTGAIGPERAFPVGYQAFGGVLYGTGTLPFAHRWMDLNSLCW